MADELQKQWEAQLAGIHEMTQAAFAGLEKQKQEDMAFINAQRDSAQADINRGSQALADQIAGASEVILNEKLQPIVINAEQKTQWGMILTALGLGWFFFRK